MNIQPRTEAAKAANYKKPLQALYKKLWKLKNSASGSKVLKYNYKSSVDKMQQKSFKKIAAANKMHTQTAIMEENVSQNPELQQKQQQKCAHRRQLSSFCSNLTNYQTSQPVCQDKRQRFRQRSVSYCKNIIDNAYSSNQYESSNKLNRKKNDKATLNPYTNSQYLHVRNQHKDEEFRKRMANQNRFSVGFSMQKSCKIMSFQLINPLEKYQKVEKMHKTNTTLPEGIVDEPEPENECNLKLQSKQVPISHRKKSSFFRHLKHAQTATKAKHQQNPLFSHAQDIHPTPWQSSVNNCDPFYLKIEQL